MSQLLQPDLSIATTVTVLMGVTYITNTMIGPAFNTLAWAMAHLGWIFGLIAMIFFSLSTYSTFAIQVTGGDGETYTDMVRSHQGEKHAKFYCVIQFLNRFGMDISCTILATGSMMAIMRSDSGTSTSICFIVYGAVQCVLSQCQNFDQKPCVSLVSAVMPITYFMISFGLIIAKVAENATFQGSSTGVRAESEIQKIWAALQALGLMNFVYSLTLNLPEILARIGSSSSENVRVKKAGLICVAVISAVKFLGGAAGYAAFGDSAPENLLSGFGFSAPHWLVTIANVAVVIHLVVIYQVFCQPLFASVEETFLDRPSWLHTKFSASPWLIIIFRVVWRTIYVLLVTVIAMLVPYFNHVVGILGVLRVWPLAVYFPVEMHIAAEATPKWSSKWVGLRLLSAATFIVSLAVAVASVAGIVYHK